MARPKGGEDVLSLLDSLGESAPETTSAPVQDPASTENEKELLGFLDDLAKQTPRSQTPRAPGATRSSRDSARNSSVPTKKSVDKPNTAEAPNVKVDSPTSESGGGGWLGGLWSMGSAAMKTAEQKVKELQQTEEAKSWEERVRGNVSVLGKLSTLRTIPSLSSTFTSVLNTIAPPIEKHEVLKVGIYHDMVGYPNIDKIVYDVFDKVMGQVEGGSLVVQKGREGKRRGSESQNQKRDYNVCEGLDEALKLAKANVAEPLRTPIQDNTDPDSPIHVSHIHLSIQPTIYSMSIPSTPPPPSSTDPPSTPVAISPPDLLFAYVLYLVDPVHDLEFSAISQGFPVEWLRWQEDVEEIAEAIEDWLQDGLKLGVACVAQGYVAKRMGIGEGRRREEKGKDKE